MAAKRTSTDAGFDRFLRRLGKRIKELRIERGLTQEDMMDFGFAWRRYQRIEAGQQPITLRTAYRLARAFKVTVADLIHDVG